MSRKASVPTTKTKNYNDLTTMNGSTSSNTKRHTICGGGSAANRWERDNINHMHQPLAYIGYNQMGQITSWLLNFTRSIHLRANLCWAICNG